MSKLSFCLNFCACNCQKNQFHYDLEVPTNATKFGRHSFTTAGPETWNQLPENTNIEPSQEGLNRQPIQQQIHEAYSIYKVVQKKQAYIKCKPKSDTFLLSINYFGVFFCNFSTHKPVYKLI